MGKARGFRQAVGPERVRAVDMSQAHRAEVSHGNLHNDHEQATTQPAVEGYRLRGHPRGFRAGPNPRNGVAR